VVLFNTTLARWIHETLLDLCDKLHPSQWDKAIDHDEVEALLPVLNTWTDRDLKQAFDCTVGTTDQQQARERAEVYRREIEQKYSALKRLNDVIPGHPQQVIDFLVETDRRWFQYTAEKEDREKLRSRLREVARMVLDQTVHDLTKLREMDRSFKGFSKRDLN
jgi:hypothetical protein